MYSSNTTISKLKAFTTRFASASELAGKIDPIEDAYFVIPVWEHHKKYFRFIWKGTLLEFACVPFGLATTPRLFHKIMKPVVALLRRAGIRLI